MLPWRIRILCDWSFRLYHHIIYICYFVASYLFLFDMIGPDGVVLCCYKKRFCFSLESSALATHRFSCVILSLVSRLNRLQSCLSSYFLFSDYLCINAILNAGMSYSSVVSWHIICQRHLWICRAFHMVISFLVKFSGPFQEGSRVYYADAQSNYLYLLYGSSYIIWFRVAFVFS